MNNEKNLKLFVKKGMYRSRLIFFMPATLITFAEFDNKSINNFVQFLFFSSSTPYKHRKKG